MLVNINDSFVRVDCLVSNTKYKTIIRAHLVILD